MWGVCACVCLYIYICVHNGVLFCHKKEQYWVICSDVDGPVRKINAIY